MHESTAYDVILEEGLEKGLEKGRMEEARRILLRQGEQLFGKPASSEERTQVESVNSLEELEQLTDRILQVHTWEALLAGITSVPSRRRKKKK